MKLHKVYFDAYKSLLNKEIEISDSCIGFVGINESGKSNLLSAISTLSTENSLKISDIPKMEKRTSPCIRFQFMPDKNDLKQIVDSIHQWTEQSKDEIEKVISSDIFIYYHVVFDSEKQTERRFFTINNLKKPLNVSFLRYSSVTDKYLIHRDGKLFSLDKILYLTDDEIEANTKNIADSERLVKVNEELSSLESKIAEFKTEEKPAEKSQEVEGSTNEDQTVTTNHQLIDNQLEALQKQIAILQEEKTALQVKLENFNIYQVINQKNNEFLKIEAQLKQCKIEINTIELELRKFQQSPNANEIQQQIETKRSEHIKLKKKEEKLNIEINELQNTVKALQEPLRDKFSDDSNEIAERLGIIAMKELELALPKVVFWKHSPDYILQGETLLEKISAANSLEEISRPLVNLFRIGLKINTLEELKRDIAEIQGDPSERSRKQKQLNIEINNYLQSVWSDYDQKINISLEQERIRVEFYDPTCEDASYYNMGERSQGCQTFISFLLTIGAEAKQGVISNTVLLLDEPETHLHPSGVRFMLQELIRASKNNNYVFFATHSIFMIDRDNYNRHIILKKEKEQTLIQLASIERIGFFMLEEVLYSTLDINLNKDFESAKQYNFVFEGNADVKLFQCVYEKCLNQKQQPFKLELTRFYQGGKCSDIQKYFKHKPIQLGAVWIFILDSDKPADDLKTFIENKYLDFINKYVYIFQYSREDVADKLIELEDLLPNTILTDSINEAANKLGVIIDQDSISFKDKDFRDVYSNIVVNNEDQDSFKSTVKDILNTKVALELKEIKNKDGMEKIFPNYLKWSLSIINHIRETQDNLNQELKQKKAAKKDEKKATNISESKNKEEYKE